MYLIINETEKSFNMSQSIPELDNKLDAGHKIIVISLYSNTIKVPFKGEYGYWEMQDYHIPSNGVSIPSLGFNWPMELNKLP